MLRYYVRNYQSICSSQSCVLFSSQQHTTQGDIFINYFWIFLQTSTQTIFTEVSVYHRVVVHRWRTGTTTATRRRARRRTKTSTTRCSFDLLPSRQRHLRKRCRAVLQQLCSQNVTTTMEMWKVLATQNGRNRRQFTTLRHVDITNAICSRSKIWRQWQCLTQGACWPPRPCRPSTKPKNPAKTTIGSIMNFVPLQRTILRVKCRPLNEKYSVRSVPCPSLKSAIQLSQLSQLELMIPGATRCTVTIWIVY